MKYRLLVKTIVIVAMLGIALYVATVISELVALLLGIDRFFQHL